MYLSTKAFNKLLYMDTVLILNSAKKQQNKNKGEEEEG